MSKLYIKRRIKYRLGGYRKRREKSGGIYILQFIIIALISVTLLFFAGQRVCSLAIRLSEIQLENEIRYESNRIAYELLTEYNEKLNSIISRTLGSDNKTTSVSADFTELNNLKFKLTDKLTQYFASHNEVICKLPIGAFFSEDIFAAQGIKIPIKITSTGSAQVDVTDDFNSAGINQTRHRLMLRITARVQLHTVYDKIQKEIIIDVPITETITVGDVPSLVTDRYDK